jgi:hypothetical protein
MRVRIGPLEIGSLVRGRARQLSPKERATLHRYAQSLSTDVQLEPQRVARRGESRFQKSPSKRSRKPRESH